MRRRRVELGIVSVTAALTSAAWLSIAAIGEGDDDAPASRVNAQTAATVADRREVAACASCSLHAVAVQPVEERAPVSPRASTPTGAVAPVASSEAVATTGVPSGERDAMRAELTRLLDGVTDSLEPTVELWLALATLHSQTGRFEDAARCIEAAYALDSTNEAAKGALAGLPSEVRRRLLERLVKRQPTNDELLGDLADAAAESGDSSAAIEAYLRAMELDPRDSEWAGKVAELDPARGATLLERAAAARPDRADVLANLALTYFAQGRDAAAFPAFQRALALDPEERIARRLVRMDARRAVPFLERALASTPDRDELWADLGEGYAALDRTADAVRAFRRARELDPTEPGWSARLLELDPASELASAEQRARATPGDDELWGELGDAYASAGRTQDALAAYRRAAELDPDDREWPPKIADLEDQ